MLAARFGEDEVAGTSAALAGAFPGRSGEGPVLALIALEMEVMRLMSSSVQFTHLKKLVRFDTIRRLTSH